MLLREAAAGLAGFAIAELRPAPPVYDPGGLTALVDDFVVVDLGDWPTVGQALLDEALRRAAARAPCSR